MRLIQFKDPQGVKAALVDETDQVSVIDLVGGTYALAMMALQHQVPLKNLIQQHLGNQVLSYQELIDAQRLLPPLTHPDAAHCLVTGTGLTHLGSADTRAAMHAKLDADDANLSDSMRMFKMGLEGGRPAPGQIGVQPEWFYKGDGDCVVAPECALPVPGCAQDAGEEPELVGLYVIAPDGTPVRLGFAVGNEFSDHITERHNYLWLAHSKLRACSFGPEILMGDLPADLRGESRIMRDDQVLWSKPFVTGEANMAHTLANLEHHHFKYAGFRRPGDVHVHFFGTSTLSFADGIRTQAGDRFEISLGGFGRALRNPIGQQPADALITIKEIH
ncbi:MAG: AraD1 family protein [Castellaniella sp.]|uniref:AraD1 family protein n=1 Tax=Castellaniella sp. TaxID=1955812 RepID=UPI003C76C302